MRQAKEPPRALRQELWWAGPSSDEPTKRPNSRRLRPLHNNNSRRKRKQRLCTNRGSTPLSGRFPLAWMHGDTPLSDYLSSCPSRRLPVNLVQYPASSTIQSIVDVIPYFQKEPSLGARRSHLRYK